MKIIFDCISDDDNFIMTSKTKKFELKELIIFNNELIYFFNINPNKSSINIYFEINGKKHIFNDIEIIKLKDINNLKNEEKIIKIKEGLELIFNIKLLDKFNKKEICDVFHQKIRESINLLKKKSKVIVTGVSIQERVKLFSEKGKDKNQQNKNKLKPGKLKVPIMFQKSCTFSKDNNKINSKLKENDKVITPKSSEKKIINQKEIKKNEKDETSKDKIIENKKEEKKVEEIKKEEKKVDEIKNEEKKVEEIKKEEKKLEDVKNKETRDEIINTNKENVIENKNNDNSNFNKKESKIEDSYDFKEKLNINENLNDKINENNNNIDFDDLYEDREDSDEEENEKNDDKIAKDEDECKEEIKSKEEVDNINENKNIKDEKKIEKVNEEIMKNEKMTEDINKLEEEKKNMDINTKEDEIKIKRYPTGKDEQINIPKEKETHQSVKNPKLGSTMSYHKKVKGSPSFKSLSGDIFLESQNYATYLKSLHQKGLKESKRETFCEGFFISSFPFKNPSVIEKSQSFPAPCGHEECSKLPSMKPEIIMRYPLKDTKNLELNNLAASICFPTGIKVCYSEDKPPVITDYVTPITNQKGERYYMMTFHFYKKYSRDEYDKQYEMHPLKHHLMRFGDDYLSLNEDELNKEKIKEIQNSLEFCQELGFRDYLYVPYCLSIISKYPYINEISICLKSIYQILNKDMSVNNDNEEEKYEINNLLMHLIHGVPIPEQNSIVKFFIPYYDKKLELKCPKIEDINIMNVNTISLLKVFSIDHIVTIFKLILLEKKILFIDKYYERLAKITDCFITLLYPFQWIHTYIPIMSQQMIKYVEAFLPYINGIHDSLLPLVTNIFNENDDQSEEVFLVYINEDRVRLSSTLRGENKNKKKYFQDNIPSIPSELEKKLKNKLKKMKSDYCIGQKRESIVNSAEIEMRDIFIDFFIDMFQGYEKYLFLLDDQEVIFNKTLFLETVPKCDQKFYNDLIDSQLFQNFAQNIIKEDFNYYFNKLNYKEKERESKKNKKTKEQSKESAQTLNLNTKINSLINYVVAPDYLNIKDTEVKNIELLLKKRYTLDKSEPLNIENRIMTNIIDVDKNKFMNDNCLIYITPEQIKAEKCNLKNNRAELRRSEIPKYTGTIMVLKAKMNVKFALRNTIKESDANEKKKIIMKEFVRDIIVKIFKSEVEDIDSNIKNNFMKIVEMPFGREYFISLISHNEKLVLLKFNAFKLFGNLFYNTLIATLKIDENDKVIEEIVLLIKSSKSFGVKEKGKTITIFDGYKRKIENTPKIMQYNFWKKTFDLELKSSKRKENDNDVQIKQNIICNIISEMVELKMIKSTIKSIIEKINNEIFGKDNEISENSKKIFLSHLNKARHLSKKG